ncbi:MAG: hypothetical protein IT205_03085 [Fimbriimonadaceae bacterium]|nr:hypothetical protein [Fimbriimonadaceae bacterium]
MNLERLAELINAKWHDTAEFIGDRQVIPNVIRINTTENVAGSRGFCFCPKWGDLSMNAYWIIWCLDRLEELGVDGLLWKEDGRFGCNYNNEGFCTFGKTRAEACALALMQALEGK